MNTTRLLGVALALSLALNLFVGGLYVGQWLRAGDSARDNPSDASAHKAFKRSFTGAISALPLEARVAVEAAIDERRDDIRERVEAVRTARANASATMSVEPFDAAAAAVAFADLRARTAELQAVLHAVVASVAHGLDPTEREQLSAAMLFPRAVADDPSQLLGIPLL